jgi:mono/diheme cytochrome c family protein
MPPGTRAPEALRDTVVSFAADILPIFQQRCAQCHGGEGEDGEVYTEAYLDLQTYKGVMAGSEYGPVVTPGDPGESVLIEMISEGEMPEEGDPVPPEEIAIISAWIEAGAPDN